MTAPTIGTCDLAGADRAGGAGPQRPAVRQPGGEVPAGGMTDGGDPVQLQPALGELLARPGQRVDGAGDVGQRRRPAAALARPAGTR